jgi:hypothetical protein
MAALYEKRGGALFATELTRGPWSPDAQHGGAPAALLMGEFERFEADPALMLARVTYELLRPVPLGELHLTRSLLRAGRRVQLLEASLRTCAGIEVVRARALRVRRAEVSAGEADQPPPGPDQGAEGRLRLGDGLRRFPGDGIELRFVRGSFYEPGPATVWFRLLVPVVAGEQPSPLQRLAAAADFPNGIATELAWERHTFVNPDLTIQLEREPLGEWICLNARMRTVAGGLGFAEAVLYDVHGRVGRSSQSLYVAPR